MQLFLKSKESKDSSKYTVQIHYKHQRKGRKSRKNMVSMHLFRKSKESKDISEYTIHLHYKYQRRVERVERCSKTMRIHERMLMWLHFFIRDRSACNSNK